MSKMSRDKGKRVERMAVNMLKSLGFRARRTAQVRGKNDGAADVEIIGLDVHIEVKGDRSIGLGTKALFDACEQAARDANGKPWCVLWWEHRKGWRLTLDCGPMFGSEQRLLVTVCVPWAIKTAIECLSASNQEVSKATLVEMENKQ